MYLWHNSLLMLPSLILLLKLAVQMMCNHVLYRNDVADFVYPQAAFALPQQLFCFTACSGFSSVAVGDYSKIIKLYSSHNQWKLYNVY